MCTGKLDHEIRFDGETKKLKIKDNKLTNLLRDKHKSHQTNKSVFDKTDRSINLKAT